MRTSLSACALTARSMVVACAHAPAAGAKAVNRIAPQNVLTVSSIHVRLPLRARQAQRGSNARRTNKSLLASPARQPARRLENRASLVFSDHTISRERHNIEAKRASDAAESAGCSPPASLSHHTTAAHRGSSAGSSAQRSVQAYFFSVGCADNRG